jgi:Ca2+/Na+ antiporter
MYITILAIESVVFLILTVLTIKFIVKTYQTDMIVMMRKMLFLVLTVAILQMCELGLQFNHLDHAGFNF